MIHSKNEGNTMEIAGMQIVSVDDNQRMPSNALWKNAAIC